MAKKKKKTGVAPSEAALSNAGTTATGPAPRPEGRSSRWWRLAFAAAAAAVALFAIANYSGSRPRAVRRDPGLSVLLVTIDTLRADALGCYGRAGAETAWIDRLASHGVRFERAHAQNVVTLPSHANILSGRYALDHGIRDNAGFRFPAEAETLATRLGKAGYRTGAFVSAFPLDSRFGLDRGFEVYDDRLGDPEGRTAFVMQERPGHQTVEAARAWLAAQAGHKTFLWLHLYEPHFPYAPPEPFASRFRSSPYHGEVAYTDALLQPLLAPILDGKSPPTLVVLTADHGEGLGEHGEATHGIFAYETTLRVPLILHAPSLLAPRTVVERVRHVDVLPTVLDALGLEVPDGLPGRSLLGLANGQSFDPPASYFEAMSSALNRGWAPLAGVATGPFKLIDLPIPELYDLDRDPREEKNLAASEPQRLVELRAQLDRLRQADRGLAREEESADTRERLQALGYVSGTVGLKARYTDADDPKSLIRLDAALQDVVALYQAGELEKAIAKARAVLAERPDMTLAWQQLGFILHEAGDLDGAVDSLKRSVAANPEDVDGVALLGAYLNDAGRHRECVQVLEIFARREPPDLDVLQAYGAALAQVGRQKEAIATFERASKLDPSNPMSRANLGTVHLMRGELSLSRSLMEEALRLEPGVSRAWNGLGVIAAREGRMDEAIEHWKRAVEANPREWDTVFNLGLVLRQRGREVEARPYLERFVRDAPKALYGPDIARIAASLGRTSS
jgi:arylsulfatase A-like enzyme/Tfp pilus assembly protein PilF